MGVVDPDYLGKSGCFLYTNTHFVQIVMKLFKKIYSCVMKAGQVKKINK